MFVSQCPLLSLSLPLSLAFACSLVLFALRFTPSLALSPHFQWNTEEFLHITLLSWNESVPWNARKREQRLPSFVCLSLQTIAVVWQSRTVGHNWRPYWKVLSCCLSMNVEIHALERVYSPSSLIGIPRSLPSKGTQVITCTIIFPYWSKVQLFFFFKTHQIVIALRFPLPRKVNGREELSHSLFSPIHPISNES